LTGSLAFDGGFTSTGPKKLVGGCGRSLYTAKYEYQLNGATLGQDIQASMKNCSIFVPREEPGGRADINATNFSSWDKIS